MFRPSRNVLCRSKMPSPSVSSWIVILSLPRKWWGGGGRDLVVDGPPDAVVADHLQPGGEGILQVLHHPEPPALVEGDRDRLADDRLGQNQIELEIVGNLECGQGRARARAGPGLDQKGGDSPWWTRHGLGRRCLGPWLAAVAGGREPRRWRC